MKHLARYALFLTFHMSCSSLCFAQGEVRASKLPPPPPPAIEYNASAWQEFISAEGGFSVRLVGKPQLTYQNEFSEKVGEIRLPVYSLKTRVGQYFASCFDFPNYREDSAFKQFVLNYGRDGLLRTEKNARLLAEQGITAGGIEWRELLIESDGALMRQRAALVRGKLCQLMLVVPLNVAFTKARPSDKPEDFTSLYVDISKRFFDSFKLLPAPPAAAGVITGTPLAGDSTTSTTEPEPKARVAAGVLNGRAINRPLPAYPPDAKAAGASGEVRVKTIFDETGKVIWAKAVSGPQLLHTAAEDAARRTTFQPVLVEGKPEKVMGFLIYKFTLQ